MMFWLRMAAQLWNKAISRPADDLLHAALLENISLACARGMKAKDRKTLWASHFIDCVESMGLPWSTEAGAPAKINTTGLMSAITHKHKHKKWQQYEWAEVERVTSGSPEWLREQSAVRAAPISFSRGFKKFTYSRWFATKFVRKQSFAFHLSKQEHVRTVMQFRLGSFRWLNIQAGRCMKRRMPRHQRVCPCCKDMVEDEGHVLQCPLYADIWNNAGLFEHPSGGWSDSDIHAAFNFTTKDKCTKFAECLVQCKKRKEALLCPELEVARRAGLRRV